MSVRIYIRRESIKRLEQALERTANMDKTAPYFQLDLDPTHPASSTGGWFAPEDVLGVSWKEVVNAGFRPDGYYEIANAHLHIKTALGGNSQVFDAWGKDYKTLQTLVLKVRTGELQPRFDFTAKAKAEVEPMVIQTEVEGSNPLEVIRKSVNALRELMQSALQCGMREISHSTTPIGEGKTMIIVSGFVPKATGPNFD